MQTNHAMKPGNVYSNETIRFYVMRSVIWAHIYTYNCLPLKIAVRFGRDANFLKNTICQSISSYREGMKRQNLVRKGKPDWLRSLIHNVKETSKKTPFVHQNV